MLVINADDFGMNEGVNKAVVNCFRAGACTSATVMANMPGFEEACSLAFQHGFQEHVGMHLVLNEGSPLTTEIRKEKLFCTAEGGFCLSRESPIFSLTGKQKSALAAEIRGQIGRCRKQGIPVSHIDSHHHVHTEWGIGAVLIPIAREERIPFIRIARNLKKKREIARGIYKFIYNANLERAGMRATRYFGSVEEYLFFLDAGRDAAGTTEIMVHPKYAGGDMKLSRSMGMEEFLRLMKPHLERWGGGSFRDLISRVKK